MTEKGKSGKIESPTTKADKLKLSADVYDPDSTSSQRNWVDLPANETPRLSPSSPQSQLEGRQDTTSKAIIMAESASASSPKPLQSSSNPMDPTTVAQNPSSRQIQSPSNLSQSPSIDHLPQISSPPLPPLPQISNPQSQQQQQQSQLLQQQQQLSPTASGLDYPQKSLQQQQQHLQQQQQQQQQQQSQPLMQQSQNANANSMSNYQIHQSLQRSPSMSRLSQIQQQQQQFGVMRQQASLYGQMNFGGSTPTQLQNQQQQQQQQSQQQQQIGGSNLSRSALIGQSGHLPMLPGATAAQFNLLGSVC